MGAILGHVRRSTSRAFTLGDAGVDLRSSGGTAGVPATPERALRLSSVWAALRLRSDLISTLPVDIYRKDGTGRRVAAAPTRLFRRPADGLLWHEWFQATQMDLDRYGNTFGHVVDEVGGYPVQIEPFPAAEVTILLEGRRITGYRVGRRQYERREIWHEKQYLAAGVPFGLSPLAYAAWAIGAGVSAQEFALDWFANGATPSGTLRHTEAVNLDQKVLDAAKARFKAATANRDLFATGKEWEFSPAAVDANSAQFLEQMDHSAVDVARYIGVPATAIDAAVKGESLTYANVSQNQLALLVNFLSAPIIRRELALTANALPQPRFMKCNTDSLLRLDPASRTDLVAKQIDSWVMTPDEARQLEDRPPLTPAEIELLKSRTSKATAQSEEDE